MNVFLAKGACFISCFCILGAVSALGSLAFDPSQWTLTPDQGTIVNANTTMEFTGPTGNLNPSFDSVTFTPPYGGSWVLVLDWSLNAGASDNVLASYSVSGQNSVALDSGSQVIGSGAFTVDIPSGQTASILFESQTGEGKTAPSFDLTLISSVPEPATWLWAVLLVAFLGLNYLRARWQRGHSQ